MYNFNFHIYKLKGINYRIFNTNRRGSCKQTDSF